MVGRDIGAKEGFTLGYANGKEAADDDLKAQAKRAKYELDRTLDNLVKDEREIVILKFEAKKKSIPTR
jgi:hypothetical protein